MKCSLMCRKLSSDKDKNFICEVAKSYNEDNAFVKPYKTNCPYTIDEKTDNKPSYAVLERAFKIACMYESNEKIFLELAKEQLENENVYSRF